MASRQELQRRLDKLDEEMPQLVAQYLDQDDFAYVFAEAFTGIADTITDDASTADADWAFDQVDHILEKHGFIADFDVPASDD